MIWRLLQSKKSSNITESSSTACSSTSMVDTSCTVAMRLLIMLFVFIEAEKNNADDDDDLDIKYQAWLDDEFKYQQWRQKIKKYNLLVNEKFLIFKYFVIFTVYFPISLEKLQINIFWWN